ncbi:hypothetical protein QYM36_005023, partial [Artemia franciscana]
MGRKILAGRGYWYVEGWTSIVDMENTSKKVINKQPVPVTFDFLSHPMPSISSNMLGLVAPSNSTFVTKEATTRIDQEAGQNKNNCDEKLENNQDIKDVSNVGELEEKIHGTHDEYEKLLKEFSLMKKENEAQKEQLKLQSQ